MKKFLTLALVCCLVFSSSSTVFATATQWDTSDQANLRYIYQSVTSGGSLYNLVNNIYSRLGTVSNTLTDIKSYLFDSNHDIAYWVHAINTWMQPMYTAISSIPNNHEEIKRLLGYVSSQDGVEVIDPYLAYQSKGVAQWVSELSLNNENLAKALTNYFANNNSWSTIENVQLNSHRSLIYGTDTYRLFNVKNYGSSQYHDISWNKGTPIGNLAVILKDVNDNLVNSYTYRWFADLTGYDSNQYAQSWTDISQNNTFKPNSLASGVYSWLSNIQTPVARLSYVLANDQEIKAREAAADKQDAVVDNFIDSSGSGSASASDIGSVSDLSSGFKNNISTDASMSGIWNIFNSENFGWFSQETANQLDTTGSSKRTLRSSSSYPTPLLDQQTEDIIKYIGGDSND